MQPRRPQLRRALLIGVFAAVAQLERGTGFRFSGRVEPSTATPSIILSTVRSPFRKRSLTRLRQWTNPQDGSGSFIKEESPRKLALLIDADNTTPHVMDELIHEVSKYGTVKIKRIYGDWGSPNLQGWRTKIMEHALVPVQQMAYVKGKGATDSALIIDCMDIFYTEDCAGFVLVSSDSDFARLGLRLREGGKLVVGVGRRQTPQAFVSACDRFVRVENLLPAGSNMSEAAGGGGGEGEHARGAPKGSGSGGGGGGGDGGEEEGDDPERVRRQWGKKENLIRLLTIAAEDTADEEGWSRMSLVSDSILKVNPDFDTRTYGYKKFSEMVLALEVFDVNQQQHVHRMRRNNLPVKKPEVLKTQEDTEGQHGRSSGGREDVAGKRAEPMEHQLESLLAALSPEEKQVCLRQLLRDRDAVVAEQPLILVAPPPPPDLERLRGRRQAHSLLQRRFRRQREQLRQYQQLRRERALPEHLSDLLLENVLAGGRSDEGEEGSFGEEGKGAAGGSGGEGERPLWEEFGGEYLVEQQLPFLDDGGARNATAAYTFVSNT